MKNRFMSEKWNFFFCPCPCPYRYRINIVPKQKLQFKRKFQQLTYHHDVSYVHSTLMLYHFDNFQFLFLFNNAYAYAYACACTDFGWRYWRSRLLIVIIFFNNVVIVAVIVVVVLLLLRVNILRNNIDSSFSLNPNLSSIMLFILFIFV
jgi:hypothetical protein